MRFFFAFIIIRLDIPILIINKCYFPNTVYEKYIYKIQESKGIQIPTALTSSNTETKSSESSRVSSSLVRAFLLEVNSLSSGFRIEGLYIT